MRQPVLKLAASAIPALVRPFKNELLNSEVTWPQDVNYLRDTYNTVRDLFDKYTKPEEDKTLFEAAKVQIQELVAGLEDVAKVFKHQKHIQKWLGDARNTAEMAMLHAKGGDYANAVIYQSYALGKFHTLLEALTSAARKRTFAGRTSSLFKKAYGYDVSGEVHDGSGSIAQQENKTLEDTAQPSDHHETGTNPANSMRDADAEKEFPDLVKGTNLISPRGVERGQRI